MNTKFFLIQTCMYLSFALLPHQGNCIARTHVVDPSNYTGYLSSLVPGDTVYFSAGSYLNQLKLKNVQGSEGNEIVFTGASRESVIFSGNACCNTVSLTQCAYVIIANITIDGQNIPDIDGIKAEGTAGNWTHHITIENVLIIGHGGGQQTCGISTKCHSWNWIIRKNVVIRAGTGLYLGNSNGDAPFVNGVIENNLVMHTVGYNMEIKYQLDTVRGRYPGTAVDGRTIIRHNVFCKDSNASTGGNARPNLLVGGFPLTGWGANDLYEIYGNFFYQNPVEALFQGTGNVALYNNIFVNHNAPSGFRAVYIMAQDGKAPRNVRVFHNTMWANYDGGGFRVYGADKNFRQYCFANTAFSPNPVSNFSDTVNNTTDSYASASNYLSRAVIDLAALDVYPLLGACTGAITPDTAFLALTDYGKDFNGDDYNWTYRGAYSGSGQNNGWLLKLDTMPSIYATTTFAPALQPSDFRIEVFPNPANNFMQVAGIHVPSEVAIYTLTGEKLLYVFISDARQRIDVRSLRPGVYFIRTGNGAQMAVRMFIRE